MNAGVDLVQAYLHLNGYFTITELPVIRHSRKGYEEVTDLDVLAIRFPWAAFVIPSGRPGPEDDEALDIDTELVSSAEIVDVVIGEVKEGKARVNSTLQTTDALLTALRRTGVAPPRVLAGAVDELRTTGRVRIPISGKAADVQVRILAFGDGASGQREGYEVVSLRHVARWVESYLSRYHEVLRPSDLPEAALGILHLLRKVR